MWNKGLQSWNVLQIAGETFNTKRIQYNTIIKIQNMEKFVMENVYNKPKLRDCLRITKGFEMIYQKSKNLYGSY